MTATDRPGRHGLEHSPAHLAARHGQRQHGPALGARCPRRSQRQPGERAIRRVPAGAPRLRPARQDDRRRASGRRADADRRRPGHRQDDDGSPDGAQRRLQRSGQRPVHLLRARGAVPAQPARRSRVGPGPSSSEDGRDQDPGRAQGNHGLVDGRGRRRSGPDREPEASPQPGPDRPVRPEPLPDARQPDGQHDRQPAQAHPAASRPVGRPAAAGGDRLHAKGSDVPGAQHRGREGHVHRQRPQGHRPVRAGAR